MTNEKNKLTLGLADLGEAAPALKSPFVPGRRCSKLCPVQGDVPDPLVVRAHAFVGRRASIQQQSVSEVAGEVVGVESSVEVWDVARAVDTDGDGRVHVNMISGGDNRERNG